MWSLLSLKIKGPHFVQFNEPCLHAIKFVACHDTCHTRSTCTIVFNCSSWCFCFPAWAAGLIMGKFLSVRLSPSRTISLLTAISLGWARITVLCSSSLCQDAAGPSYNKPTSSQCSLFRLETWSGYGVSRNRLIIKSDFEVWIWMALNVIIWEQNSTKPQFGLFR